MQVMESAEDKESQGSFLKIDTVWSEAEENLVIKEEIVSDVEPDSIPSANENSSDVDHANSLKVTGEDENYNSNFNRALLSSWQALKKKIKTKNHGASTKECEPKSSCSHDTKNFRIVKLKLRCGDCMSLVCPECCKVIPSTLQSHFSGTDVSNRCSYLCKVCSIPFNSLCALQAHIRIHTLGIPYVCPDCGLIYNNIYFLILHLINKCCHVYKIVRYKCKNCPGAYFTSEMFVQHIQQLHIENVCRCLCCSSLFSNSEEFNYHMESVHQKQKAQYLSYFKCSLCSNMVIPRFMYQKHITQHFENWESFEVNYQCLCDEIYSLIGAFRAHIQHCKVKGTLPPQWSFLQGNLKSHELPHNENLQAKGVLHALPRCSNSNAEPVHKKLSLLRPSDENVPANDNESIAVNDKEKSTDCESLKTNCVKSSGNLTSENRDSKSSEKIEEDSNKEMKENLPALNASESEAPDANKPATKEQLGKTDGQEAEIMKLGDTPNIQSEVEYPKETNMEQMMVDVKKKSQQTEETQTASSDKEAEQMDSDASKVLYDHIPCDHLGYLIKTQCPESVKKDSPVIDSVVLEKRLPASRQNYHIITELNEKTGLITTRKVPVENFEEEATEETTEVKGDDSREDAENLNSLNVPPKFYGIDRSKLKLGNSLFTCPFCVVLFPKHSATFQQFRLHLESYHPDAALNITVSKEESAKSAKEEVSEDSGALPAETVEAGSKSAEEGGKQTSAEANTPTSQNQSKKSSGAKKKGEDCQTTSENTNKELCQDADVPGDNSRPADAAEKENSSAGDAKPAADGEGEGGGAVAPEPSDSNTDVDKETEVSEGSKSEKRETDEANGDAGKGNNGSSDTTRTGEKDTNGDSVAVPEESGEEGNAEKGQDKKAEDKPSTEKNSPKVHSDFEDEGDTSNHSNWSGEGAKDSSAEGKTEEKERSRRESEVWSEFYESLMLAEKLKKRKPEQHFDSKKSVVSDYSAKRVVKKPKRYRESSDSGESVGGNDNSDSDDDFLLSGELAEEERSGAEGSAPDDQSQKKQKLLRKLQNIDGSFVDYLYDLVNKKEKYFELYKKHSSLRATRYSQDLRSYRKKVLNGIKHRGRPHKVLKYQEMIKKKDAPGQSEEKPAREATGQRTPQKEPASEGKPAERKRGRPRKIVESAKLKERRRSDKEVDFIEKNFEREENELSPSKRKRKLSSKLQYYKKISLTDDKEDFSSGQVISNKPPDSSRKFGCAVCKELFQDVAEFREHITGHRMEENTYQCMECGECFVVRPSLEKHLHAFHKIKNTDKYIKDNECCSIKKEVPEQESEPLKENQCKVCKDQFDRAIDLTKHFRIHGMAFLREFRREAKPGTPKA